MIFDSFFENKKVFVTGHTGFKGSWLCHWLLALGARVSGFSLENDNQPPTFKALDLSDKLQHDFRGDIANYQEIYKAIELVQPDVTFHLAAQPIVSLSYDNPLLTYKTNVIGTLNVFESLRNSFNCGIAIFITSDKCYENVETFYGYRETDRLGGHDPYSSSKACAEILLSSLGRSYPKRSFLMATARAGNVIGGGDWSQSRIIPDCIRAWMNNQPVEIRSPYSTRPWQHVLEPLSGYLLLAYTLSHNPNLDRESFNFGPSQENCITVESVVSRLSKAFTYSDYKVNKNSSIGKEAGLLSLDISKALHLLNWKPKLPATSAIDLTSAWYAGYIGGSDPSSLYSNDLRFYLSFQS